MSDLAMIATGTNSSMKQGAGPCPKASAAPGARTHSRYTSAAVQPADNRRDFVNRTNIERLHPSPMSATRESLAWKTGSAKLPSLSI